MNYKIEKNIPVLKHGNAGKWSALANKMEAGDSVLLPAKSRNEVLCLCQTLRRRNYKPVTRTVDGGIRVWATEKQNENE